MTTVVEDRQNFCAPIVKTELKNRRNRYDILAEILAACGNQPRTQSWLLSNLGLSTWLGKGCIGFLVDTNLLEKTMREGSRSISYVVTSKGNEALRIYNILTSKYFPIKIR
jgi:predicted transcriptional regulator